MDLIQPDQDIGGHAFDIRTIQCPDGSIQITSCNFQGALTDYYSWSFTDSGTVDLLTEEIVAS